MARRARQATVSPTPPRDAPALSLAAVSSLARGWLAGAALITVVAYAPALRAPFFFDDEMAIVTNESIHRLWPLSVPFDPPPDTPVTGRPIANYSLALNYAINEALGVDQRKNPDGPNKTISYHVVNLLLHLGCGALIFGLLRRTLAVERVRGWWARVAGDRKLPADLVAAAIAGIWLVHPIQSEAVNYLTQRTELLVATFYLLTLYAAVRSWDAATTGRRHGWWIVSALACLLGMGSKEVMASAPIVVALYDRAFRAGSWRALRPRLTLYVLLAAAWVWLAMILLSRPRAGTVGFSQGITWYEYLYTQGWAIARYVRLVFRPDDLIVDYGRHLVRGVAGIPGAVLVVGFGAATLFAWRRLDRLGWLAFLGAWFFLILAPSSSIVPIVTETAAERRIYLPLVSVLVLATLVAARIIRPPRALAAFAGGMTLLFGAVTFQRSRVYADPERLWRETIAALPTNPRAWEYLAILVWDKSESRLPEADSLLRRAVAIDSTYHSGYTNLAEVELARGNRREARALLERALRLAPTYQPARSRLGGILLDDGDATGALAQLEQAAKVKGNDQAAVDLAQAYLAVGRVDDAIRAFGVALELKPDRPDVLRYLGALLLENGRAGEAIPYLEGAAAIAADSGSSLGLLALGYAALGRPAEAARVAAAAASASNGNARTLTLAGRAMIEIGGAREARAYLTEAVRLAPRDVEAITALGVVAAATGQRAEATELFRRALSIDPEYPAARKGLAAVGGGG